MVLSYLGRGIAHERAGAPCQDAIGSCRTERGEVVMVLSDGAGSARYAAEAARTTVRAVMDFFGRMSLADFLALPLGRGKELLTEACAAPLRELRERLEEPDLRHFSATLVFAVIGPERALIGNLGDGMAAVLDDRGKTLLYSAPEHGPKGGNTTVFTISPEAPQKLRLYRLRRDTTAADCLILTSDGPFEMFCGRGSGDPVRTVRELRGYVRQYGLENDRDLGSVLNQMADLTEERMDDWSAVIWCTAEGVDEIPAGKIPVSMLEEEKAKYGIAAPGA